MAGDEKSGTRARQVKKKQKKKKTKKERKKKQPAAVIRPPDCWLLLPPAAMPSSLASLSQAIGWLYTIAWSARSELTHTHAGWQQTDRQWPRSRAHAALTTATPSAKCGAVDAESSGGRCEQIARLMPAADPRPTLPPLSVACLTGRLCACCAFARLFRQLLAAGVSQSHAQECHGSQL